MQVSTQINFGIIHESNIPATFYTRPVLSLDRGAVWLVAAGH